jgi:putative oxidoreductase
MSAPNPLAHHAHWALRFPILSVFLFHGLDKFGNLPGFAEMAELPLALAFGVAFAEAAGGILVFLGGFLKDWMTRLGALLLVPVMLGAITMVHWGQWHFMATETHPMGGMQFQVTLLMILVFFVLTGNRASGSGGRDGDRTAETSARATPHMARS